MKKFIAITFLVLLYSYNTVKCMELALIPQQESEMLEQNKHLVFKITIETPIPYLNMMARVNLAKTCKAWNAIINPTKIWYQKVHPGFLDKEDCRKLNPTSYTHAMIYYARKNDKTMVDFIHQNTNKDNQEISNIICTALKQAHLTLAYANTSCDDFIDSKTKEGYFCIAVNWPNIRWKKMKSIIHLFLLQGININYRFKLDASTLLHFVADGKIHFLPVDQIINHPEINVNIQNKYGHTPLHCSAMDTMYCTDNEEKTKNRLSVAIKLLERKDTDLNIQDNDGNSSLIWATRLDRKDAVELLLNNEKTNPNIVDKDDNTALHHAVKKKCNNGKTAKHLQKTVEFLLNNKKTNPNLTNKDGNTALHYATQNLNGTLSEKQAIRLINHSQIQICITNNHGYTPLDYAIQDNNTIIINLLRSKGAIQGPFFKKHKKLIIGTSLLGIFAIISASIFAYFNYNTNTITQ